jgi:hypothetical protein
MSSPGTGRWRSGQIPANRWPGPAGRGRGMDLGPLGLDSRARFGQGVTGEVGCRRPGAVVAAACCAGEVGRREEDGHAGELQQGRIEGEKHLG